MNEIYIIFIIISFIMFISLFASTVFLQFGIPTLLVGLSIGVLIRNLNSLDLPTMNSSTTLIIGELALCIIIFSGALETNPDRLLHSFREGLALSTIGVIITTLSTGLLIWIIFGFNLIFAFLLAAILVSTDAAAVFSILNLKKKFSNDVDLIIQVESGSNDPMAYFLIITLISIIKNPSQSFQSTIISLFQNFAVAVIIAIIILKIFTYLIVTFKVKVGQTPIILLSTILFLYGSNALLGGSYFLSVYLFGLLLETDNLPSLTTNINFFESFSILMETILFIILGYQIFVQELLEILFTGVVIAIMLITITRPLGVLISLLPFNKFNRKELSFISWVGLRGASPIVFGLIPIVSQIENASILFNIAFIVVLTSILIQGMSANKIGKILNIVED